MTQKQWKQKKSKEYNDLVTLATHIYDEFAMLANEEICFGKNKDRKNKLKDSLRHYDYTQKGNQYGSYYKKTPATSFFNPLKDIPKLEDFPVDSKFIAFCGLNPSLSDDEQVEFYDKKQKKLIKRKEPKKQNIFDFIDPNSSKHQACSLIEDKYTYPKYFGVYNQFAQKHGYNPAWYNLDEFVRRVNQYNITFSDLRKIVNLKQDLNNKKPNFNSNKFSVFLDPIPYRHTNSTDIKELIIKDFKERLKTKTVNDSILHKCREFLQAKLDYLNPDLTLIANAKSCELFVYQDGLMTDSQKKNLKPNVKQTYNQHLPTVTNEYFAKFGIHDCFVSGMLTSGVTAVANREMIFAAMTDYLNQLSKNPTTKPTKITLPL